MIISAKDLQSELKERSFYTGEIDGIEGPLTRDAIKSFVEKNRFKVTNTRQRRIVAEQLIFRELGFYSGEIDGLIGPSYRYAGEQWQNRIRQVFKPSRPPAQTHTKWPNRSQLESFYGPPGTGHTMLQLPYPMRLAWDKKTVVTRTTVHSKCSDSLERILKEILAVYGYEQLKSLGIDLFGGIYNNRNIRGGSVPSVHAYAAAIDLDPENNQLRWGSDRASFAKPIYSAMINSFEKEGWVSLGRERNYDWMHFQASVL